MARNKVPMAQEESPEVATSSALPAPPSPLEGAALTETGEKLPLAPTEEPQRAVEPSADPEPAVAVRRFQVLASAKAMIGGYVHTLNQGKIIDERHYDVANLRTQGVVLREVEE